MPFCRGGYGVSFGEVERFVCDNVCVADWVRKYRCDLLDVGELGLSGSRLDKARILCRFFKWLRVKKDIALGPSDLLNLQLTKRESNNILDRKWLLRLVLEHSRDNPDFKDFADMHRYGIFVAIKNFCGYHEVPLTMAKGVFGKKRKRKNHRKQINLSDAKKILGSLSQRDKAILLIVLQSGMEIGAVLRKFNYFWFSQVKPQLDAGCERLKIEFDERKGNGTWYFTYVSRDGIHELRMWLQERQRIVEKAVADGKRLSENFVNGEPIFITSRATLLRVSTFVEEFYRVMNGEVTTHMFRKLFKSEASVPDRGINRNCVEFFMGRAEAADGLDAVGGTYDRTPEINEGEIEKEYVKLEPYINIYSSSVAVSRSDLEREVAELRRSQKDLAIIRENLPLLMELVEKEKKRLSSSSELE